MADAKNPTAYHLGGCSCGQPGKEMSVDEFLRTCFLKRLNRREDLQSAYISGSSVLVPRPRLRSNSEICKRYANTELHRLNEPRNPLLCSHAHYTWSSGTVELPRPMEINLGGNTLSRVKELLNSGERVQGAHFKHWRRNQQEIDENVECFCGQNAVITADRRKEIRDAIYGARRNTIVCFIPSLSHGEWKGAGEIGTHTVLNSDGEEEGWNSVEDELSFKGVLSRVPHLSSLTQSEKPLIWLSGQEKARLPANAHQLIFPLSQGQKEITLPEKGQIYIMFEKESHPKIMKRLVGLLDQVGQEAIKAFHFDNTLFDALHGHENIICGSIAWDNPSAYELVKDLVREVTGLESGYIRQSSALRMEVFDSERNQVTNIDASYPTIYRGEEGSKVLIRIRRGRNKAIESFYINLGSGVDPIASSLGSRVRITNKDPDGGRKEHLYEIYLDVPSTETLQRALWLEINLKHVDPKETWIEIFDFGSSVETSGQQIRFVSGDVS